MNLRVLIYMNPLTVDKISKKFLWEKDSGFLYTRQLIYSLPVDYHYTILVPKGFDNKFFHNKYRHIDCVEYDYSTSIHQNRYHFNRNILAKALPYGVDIDVVLNMQPEVAASLRVFFENQRREKPIIINYFHWIDCKASRNAGEKFISRQVEGYNAADLNLFHSDDAFKLFLESAEESKLKDSILYGTSIYNIFHPLPTTYGMKPIPLPDKKIILFNHRINNSTGYHEVLDAAFRLDRNDFVIWLTDESNLKEYYLKEHSNVIMKTVPFESYGYLLCKSHFSVCNLKGYATWNMAVLDSINAGTSVLSNTTKLMARLGAIQCTDWVLALNRLLDQEKIRPSRFIEYDFTLEKYITNEIRERVKGKEPKKYKNVVSYISGRAITEKRDFVNEFWSFHANSNFQLIRWKLLSEGVHDDTNLRLTTYT